MQRLLAMNYISLSRLCYFNKSLNKQLLPALGLQCTAHIHLNSVIRSVAIPKGDPLEAYLRTKQKYECKSISPQG